MLIYIKDSNKFLIYSKAFIKTFGKLPKNGKVFKADAKSMYTNIDAEHTLWVLREKLENVYEEGKLSTS